MILSFTHPDLPGSTTFFFHLTRFIAAVCRIQYLTALCGDPYISIIPSFCAFFKVE